MKTTYLKHFGKIHISKFPGFFTLVVSIVWSLSFISCASYGLGGVYTSINQVSANQTELGGYIFGDSQFAEATVGFSANLSDMDTKYISTGFSLKFPFSFWKMTIFPLANAEYQRVLSSADNVKNLGWVRFGGGLDFSFTNAFYLRGEGMYAPDIFSSLPETDMVSLNPAKGYSVRFGLGWKPGTSRQSTIPANTNKPQPSVASNINDRRGWDIANLDTARSINYLSDLEKDIILEMNMARSEPKKYAEMYINPNQGAYARECYEELRNSEPRSLLLPKRGLSRAAKDHVADTGPQGLTGHTGTDGSSMSDRINRYGKWGYGASENISYGYNTAREIVLQLLIDDGVTSRGHRINIMNKTSKYVGVATGIHARYRYMCVQDFAVEYTDN